MNRLKTSLIIASTALVSGLGGTVLFNGIAHGEWDFPGLQQQVQHVTEVTDNHEGRITNLEAQANTPSGLPTPTPVEIVKVVTQPAPSVAVTAPPAATPASTPIPTVVTVEHRRCVNSDSGLVYFNVIITTYSDDHQTMTTPEGIPETRACFNHGTW